MNYPVWCKKGINPRNEKEIDIMIREMKNWNNWEHIIYVDLNYKFCYSYSFYEPVIHSFYDIRIYPVNDTSCTNYFNYYLFVMISIEEKYQNETLF